MFCFDYKEKSGYRLSADRKLELEGLLKVICCLLIIQFFVSSRFTDECTAENGEKYEKCLLVRK